MNKRGLRLCEQLTRRVVALLMVSGVAFALGGCSMLGLGGEKAKWADVTFAASDDVNNNSPVAVDVVLVSDAALLARLTEMPASKWFAARDDLVSTFPKGVRYRGWEIVPGQHALASGDAFAGAAVVGAFVFANYQDPGAHRVRIEHFSGHMVVKLDSNNLTVLDSK